MSIKYMSSQSYSPKQKKAIAPTLKDSQHAAPRSVAYPFCPPMLRGWMPSSRCQSLSLGGGGGGIGNGWWSGALSTGGPVTIFPLPPARRGAAQSRWNGQAPYLPEYKAYRRFRVRASLLGV